MGKTKLLHNKKFYSIITILILSSLITVAGYLYYRSEEKYILNQKHEELKTIAEVKIKQISDWYSDELNDAEIIADNFLLKNMFEELFLTNSSKVKQALLKLLNQIKLEHDYSNIIITSINNKIVAATDKKITSLEPIEINSIGTAINEKKGVSSDLFRSSVDNKIYIDFISSIKDENEQPIAAIVFKMDPNKFLYPLIQSWPTPSLSSETFMIRKEGDNVVYLNELRHQKIEALNFTLPITRKYLLAVQTINGYSGIFEGKDYREIEVLAYLSKIPNTPWFLIAKVDMDEMYAEKNVFAWFVFGFITLLVLLTGVGTAMVYNYRQSSLYKELFNREKALWESQEQFKVTMDSLGEGIITLDMNSKIQYMNKIAEELTGWELRESRGRYLGEIYPVKNEETGKRENNILDKVLKHGIVKELANHTILINKNGKEIPVMDTGAPIYDTTGTIIGIVIAFQDETEKRTQRRRLKGSEERLRSTLDNMLEGCQIIDFDFRYLFLNKTALEQAKLPKEKLLGKTMMECYPGIEYTEMFKLLKSCMENRVPASMENKFDYMNGSSKYFKLRFEPVPEGMFILSEDTSEQKISEEKIKQNEKFLTSLFNTIGDAIFTVSMPNGIIEHVNRSVKNIFGFEPNEVIGKSTRLFYPSDEAFLDYSEKLNEAITNNSQMVNAELNLKRKDGTIIWCDVQTTFLRNNGNAAQVITVLRDITEKIYARKNLTKLSNAIMHTADSIIITNKEGKIEFVNKAFENLTGYSSEEVVGKTPAILKSGEHNNSYYKNLWDTILSGKTFSAIFVNKKKNGEIYYEQKSISPIFDDKKNIIYFVSAGIDISERIKMEEEIVIAKETAEEMNRVKSYFFANMSHELRTPFVGILGFAELLRETLADQETKEMAEIIITASNRLVNTLNKILTLSKIEFEKVEFEKAFVNITEVLEDEYILFEKAASQKNLQLKKNIFKKPFFIVSDERIIRDILNNLISNAIIYTKEGSIELSTDHVKKDDREYLVIKVKDTGIGIPPEKQEIIWKEFRQASEGLSRDYEGTGLGLTITKKYCEMLGGSISLESQVDKGSTFTVEIPIQNVSPKNSETTKLHIIEKTEEKTISETLNKKVLYVEDDHAALDIINRVLSRICTIDFAITPEESLEMAAEKVYDLFLIDINLGYGIDGVKLMTMLRELPQYKKTSMVAVTAYAAESDKEEFLSKGFTHYISKPFMLQDLVTMVQNIFLNE